MSDMINALIARGHPIDIGGDFVRNQQIARTLAQRDTALAQDQQQIDQRNALMQRAQAEQDQQTADEAAQEQAWLAAIKEGDATGDYSKALQIDPQHTQLYAQAKVALRPQEPPAIQDLGGGVRAVVQGGKIVGSPEWPQRAPLEGPQRPQLVDVPQPDGTVQKQWLYPGQTSGAAVGAPAKPESAKPPAEMDKKVGTLFGSMVTAANNLAGLSGTDTSSISNATLDSNPITRPATSAEYRKYQSAAKQWSANLLYIKSGATATPEEVQSTYLQFFPQPGDTPDVKEQKAAAREQEMRNIQSVYPDTTRQYKWKPQTTGAATKARPKVGEVRHGYVFIGGDPAKKENWAKANE